MIRKSSRDRESKGDFGETIEEGVRWGIFKEIELSSKGRKEGE